MSETPLIKDVNLFLDDKPSVFALRENAKILLKNTHFPTTKTENWKYTNISPIINSNFDISNISEHCSCDNHQCSCSKETSPFIDVCFCNGKLHIEEYNTPQGLIIKSLAEVLYEDEYKKYLLKSFNQEQHPFALLNTLYLEQGICIIAEKNTQISTPIKITYKNTNAKNNQINIHNLILAQENSKIEIIEHFLSQNSNTYLTNIVNEIYTKENSAINHYKIQKESSQSFHIAFNSLKSYKNSTYKQFYFSNGSNISRNENIINLEDVYANAEIYTAYKAQTKTTTDITTNINHKHPNTTSIQLAKAILEQDAIANFLGKIHIAPNAIKTSGNQLHKALYLSENATMNCKPELEIYADDVKCSHGATCGQIDKDQLFYLTSRGISQKDAQNLLTSAHLEEIFSLISNQDIRELFK